MPWTKPNGCCALELEPVALDLSALTTLKRSDDREISLARLIRTRTGVPNEWIARKLSGLSQQCEPSAGTTSNREFAEIEALTPERRTASA